MSMSTVYTLCNSRLWIFSWFCITSGQKGNMHDGLNRMVFDDDISCSNEKRGCFVLLFSSRPVHSIQTAVFIVDLIFQAFMFGVGHNEG